MFPASSQTGQAKRGGEWSDHVNNLLECFSSKIVRLGRHPYKDINPFSHSLIPSERCNTNNSCHCFRCKHSRHSHGKRTAHQLGRLPEEGLVKENPILPESSSRTSQNNFVLTLKHLERMEILLQSALGVSDSAFRLASAQHWAQASTATVRHDDGLPSWEDIPSSLLTALSSLARRIDSTHSTRISCWDLHSRAHGVSLSDLLEVANDAIFNCRLSLEKDLCFILILSCKKDEVCKVCFCLICICGPRLCPSCSLSFE